MAQPSSETSACGTKSLKGRLSAEALRQRLARECVSRELKAQAERLVNEEATDPRWMALSGFTHDEVMYGATRRSESLLGKTRDGQGGAFEEAGALGPARARLEGPRGALSSQTLAERESLVVAQVDELTCTDFYGPGGSSSSRLTSKNFRPTPLFATVVRCWPDRSTKDREDAQEHDEESKGPVVLLSPVAVYGLVRYDHYDERSLIENRLNRDGKQHFGLGEALARNRAALLSATVFSTLALMLYRGLELHRERALEAFDQRAEPLGVLRYRRQRMLLNRGTVIIVVGDRYARMPLYEFARLAGMEVTGAPPAR